MPERTQPHTFAHWTVKVKAGKYAGYEFLLIDWLDRYTMKANRMKDMPSVTSLVIVDRPRLEKEENIDMVNPKWENNCVFGKMGGAYYIFHVDSLDLERSRSKDTTNVSTT